MDMGKVQEWNIIPLSQRSDRHGVRTAAANRNARNSPHLWVIGVRIGPEARIKVAPSGLFIAD